MRAKGRNVKCPNHRGICTANLDRTDVIGNESRSAERCAHKIAQDEKHLLLLDNSLPMVTPLQALDLKEVNKHTVPYTLKT